MIEYYVFDAAIEKYRSSDVYVDHMASNSTFAQMEKWFEDNVGISLFFDKSFRAWPNEMVDEEIYTMFKLSI